MIAQKLEISPRAAQTLVAAMGPSAREITGRRLRRAWTIS
jgi:hypothetical protein